MPKLLLGLVLFAPALGVLAVGQRYFALAVTVIAMVVLADITSLMARIGSRPVLLAAAVPGVGLPLAVTFEVGPAWRLIPAWFAAAIVVSFTLVILFGRRSGVTAALGSTALCGLIVGLGASAIILLSDLPDGQRWVWGFAALLLGAEGSALLLGRQRAGPRWAFDTGGATAARLLQPVAGQAIWASLLAVIVVGGVLAVTLAPPFTVQTAAALALVAVLAAIGGAFLLRLGAVESGADDQHGVGIGSGAILSLADGVLLGAPLAYAIARVTAI